MATLREEVLELPQFRALCRKSGLSTSARRILGGVGGRSMRGSQVVQNILPSAMVYTSIIFQEPRLKGGAG